jgi:hypothetical protein
MAEYPFWEQVQQRLCAVDAQLAAHGWRVLAQYEAISLSEGVNNRYPSRQVFVFARSDTSDDIVALNLTKGRGEGCEVLEIHDYALPGWELSAMHASMEAWAHAVIARDPNVFSP